MARQPAIEVGFFLAMAFYAESHLEINSFESVHGFDGTVAFLAGNFLFNVPLVIEYHMLG